MDGVKWLDYLHNQGLGGCLADDMGLGMTVQTIALLARLYPAETKPSLLVMPRSLLFNWQRGVARFCPALRCLVYHGANRDLDEAMRGHLVLTTYGTLPGSIEDFMEREFYYVILDESPAIKNSGTQTSKAVLLLKAQRRLALSGTPIENHLGELFSLFRFLNPAMFGSEAEFNRNCAIPIHQHNDKDAAHPALGRRNGFRERERAGEGCRLRGHCRAGARSVRESVGQRPLLAWGTSGPSGH